MNQKRTRQRAGSYGVHIKVELAQWSPSALFLGLLEDTLLASDGIVDDLSVDRLLLLSARLALKMRQRR
tara:strand:+ start:409 stop:615 length:207 start_codon:yes stop_codon:yes gene_type:complete